MRKKSQPEQRRRRQQTQAGQAGPAQLVALRHQHLQCHHGDHECRHAGQVEPVVAGGFGLAFRRAAHHPQAEHAHRDGHPKDRAPAEVLRHQAADQRAQAGTAPGTDRPHADGALALGAVPEGFQQRQAGWHDAGGRQALQRTAQQHDRCGQLTRRREGHQQRAGDAQGEADASDLHPANPIGQAAHHDDEDAREQRSDGDRDVHHARVHAEVAAHVGSDVERGLGEQPERDDTHDDAEKQPVVAGVRRLRLSNGSHTILHSRVRLTAALRHSACLNGLPSVPSSTRTRCEPPWTLLPPPTRPFRVDDLFPRRRCFAPD